MSETTYNIGRIGLVIRGTYSATTAYNVLDVVHYNSSSYACTAACTGIDPTNTQYWSPLAEGIDTVTADNLDATTVKAFIVDTLKDKFQEITTGNLTTDELYVEYAKVMKLAVGSINAGNITTNELAAVMGDFVTLHTNTAGIDYASIKDLSTGSLIFTEATGEKLYISRLAVDDANIVSVSADVIDAGTLSVERLLLVGDGGIVHEINAQSGGLTATQLTEEKYKNYLNGKVIVADSITARELNAQAIFADDATIKDLIAANLKVDTLFGREAAIDQLKTTVISNISMGGNNLILNSGFDFPIADPHAIPYDGQYWSIMDDGTPADWTSWAVIPAGTADWRPKEANVLEFHAKNKTGPYGAQQWIKLSKNTTYTFSGYMRQDRMTGNVRLDVANVDPWTNLANKMLDAPTGVGDYYSLDSFRRFSVTFNTGVAEWVRLAIWGTSYPTDIDGVIWLTRLQLEQGEVATAWNPARSEVVGEKILFNDDGMTFTGKMLSFDVEGEDGDMHLGPDGLIIPKIVSPSVVATYTGPSTVYINRNASDAQVEAGTHFRSLGALAGVLRYKSLGYALTINFTADDYYEGEVDLFGISGGHTIQINGYGSTLRNSFLFIAHCSVSINITSLNLTQKAADQPGIQVLGCQYVGMNYCVLTGLLDTTSTYAAVQVDRGSRMRVWVCEFYGNWRAVRSTASSVVNAVGCKGNCKLASDGGLLLVSGTVPDSTTSFAPGTANGGQVLGTATVDQGAATPPEPETATATFDATTAHTVYGTAEWPGSWKSDTNYTWQGYTDGMKHQASMFWFSGLNALAGKTILSAKFRIKRVAGTGKGADVKVKGYYGDRAYNNGSGSPNNRVSMGTLGNIANGETAEFTIPTAAISYLASNPSNRCIALNPGDDYTLSGKVYSSNYCKFYAMSGFRPKLEVTYVP